MHDAWLIKVSKEIYASEKVESRKTPGFEIYTGIVVLGSMIGLRYIKRKD